MYFRQFWRDPRLMFDRQKNLEKLVVGAEYINLIWTPDTFFVNEKTAYFHKATTENQFLRILHTGEILRSIRSVTLRPYNFFWLKMCSRKSMFIYNYLWSCFYKSEHCLVRVLYPAGSLLKRA